MRSVRSKRIADEFFQIRCCGQCAGGFWVRRAALIPLGLTEREAETLFWLAQGKSNSDLCILLDVKLTTIKKHLERIYQKLGVENRTSAAAMALEALGK